MPRVANKSKNVLKTFIILCLIGVFLVPFYLSYKRIQTEKNEKAQIESNANTVSEARNDNATIDKNQPSVPQNEVVTKTLPDTFSIKVPFTTQAPLVNWDSAHEEACEEASLIMVHHFIDKTTVISKESAEAEIQDLLAYESKNNYAVDVTVKELSQIAKGYYSLSKGRVVTDATIEKIKAEIAANKPVIIPAAGKMLGNPNFQNGGPNYHMLVVTGYEADEFIVNDPGTRKGEGYRYKQDVLLGAIHDWDSADITKGQKAYMVFD
ncbi:MAG: C39 family peptidase [Candidatus Berkelbacteria bacterium]